MKHNKRSTMRKFIQLSALLLIIISMAGAPPAQTRQQKKEKKAPPRTQKILLLVEGNYDLKNFVTAEGREIATILGHFNVVTTIKGSNAYTPQEVNRYDYLFYVGKSFDLNVPDVLAQDVLSTGKTVVWMNTGMIDLCNSHNGQTRLGFTVTKIEKDKQFDQVKADKRTFTRRETHLNIINVKNKRDVRVLATAVSSKSKTTAPYIVRSKNFYYIADTPVTLARETDRYLLFADMLHDILKEPHQKIHRALIRIEDVNPMSNPDKLRDIADILSERGIPFLVGVSPFYVNPSEDLRISLTEKPEVVDALKYMVRNGGTIVMHGVTHQYKGITTDDFEFWDNQAKGPIAGETEEEIARKIELGIDEFMKNGLYPLLWETPHYTGSFKTYKTVAKYFSTAVEQRLAIEDIYYGQYYPYIIYKDLFGQKIYPENLGYIQMNTNHQQNEEYVEGIIGKAKVIMNVRDGFASCFFHPFLDLSLLEDLVSGITDLGFSYIDVRDATNWVKSDDKVILTGSQPYSITLNNSFLFEAYFDQDGDIIKKEMSPKRITGRVNKNIQLETGQVYIAEPVEYHEKETSLGERFFTKAYDIYDNIVSPDKEWDEARVVLCLNHFSRGGFYNNQMSYESLFNSLNINVKKIYAGEKLDLKNCNLLVVPYSFVTTMKKADIDLVVKFVDDGGCLITDRRNKLIEQLGIKFLSTTLKVFQLQDRFHPNEHITWKFPRLMQKFEYNSDDKIFCEDVISGFPMVIGRKYGDGKVLYFNSSFDPDSELGYSHFPYAFEYIRNFFKLSPVVRRENLEFYFDPGLRQTVSVENLVKGWVKHGVRIIHVAGWHQYPKYTYDYDRLIRLAHANGILIYAWLEPPQVNQKFWTDHPEWREKNSVGQDVRPSWRYPVALTDGKCFDATVDEYISFLKSHEFDGVNIAELYFESDAGFENPENFTPCHPSVQRDMKRLYNIDLLQALNPESEQFAPNNPAVRESIVKYRVAKIYELHDRILKRIYDFAKDRDGFEVMVTTMDSHGSPELVEDIGVRTDDIVKLQKKYGFFLQIEDPERMWSTSPDRYKAMGELYAKKMGGENRLLLDLNILTFRDKNQITPFPTLIQTGIESYQLVYHTALGSPRFSIYSEATVNPQDLALFSYASSARVKYTRTDKGYDVESPHSFTLKLPKNTRIILIDGNPLISTRENQFLIPAGKHTITLLKGKNLGGFSTVQLQPQIVSFTGNILDAKCSMRKITMKYEANERALLSVSSDITSAQVDGEPYESKIMLGNDCHTIYLPAGSHDVEIETVTDFVYGIDVTSLWSTKTIALFGSVAVSMLLIMYFGLKIIRRRSEA